jgi:flagellar biosynthesis component FlhA
MLTDRVPVRNIRTIAETLAEHAAQGIADVAWVRP